MFGLTIITSKSFGEGSFITSILSTDLTKVIPPKIIGATLSAWYDPLTNLSPSIEDLIRSK